MNQHRTSRTSRSKAQLPQAPSSSGVLADSNATTGTAHPLAQQQQERHTALQQRPGADDAAAHPEAQPQFLLTVFAAFDGNGDAAAGTSGVFNGTVTKLSDVSSGAAQQQAVPAILQAPAVSAPLEQDHVPEAALDAADSADTSAEDSASGLVDSSSARSGERQPPAVLWHKNPTARHENPVPATRSTRESSFYSVASGGAGADEPGDISSGGGGDGSTDGERYGAEGPSSDSGMSSQEGGLPHLLDVDDAGDAAVLAKRYRWQ